MTAPTLQEIQTKQLALNVPLLWRVSQTLEHHAGIIATGTGMLMIVETPMSQDLSKYVYSPEDCKLQSNSSLQIATYFWNFSPTLITANELDYMRTNNFYDLIVQGDLTLQTDLTGRIQVKKQTAGGTTYPVLLQPAYSAMAEIPAVFEAEENQS